MMMSGSSVILPMRRTRARLLRACTSRMIRLGVSSRSRMLGVKGILARDVGSSWVSRVELCGSPWLVLNDEN
jgi:hypothetical protein